jgi:hypothetical protein
VIDCSNIVEWSLLTYVTGDAEKCSPLIWIHTPHHLNIFWLTSCSCSLDIWHTSR